MPPVRRQPEYERVAEELRDMIVRGELKPGDRLPAEPDLTTRMSVGRGTLREALRLLSSQKLLTTRRGTSGGTFVAEPTPDDVADYLQTSLTLLSRGRLSVAQLLEVRSMLEVPAAGLAARRRSNADLKLLSESIILVDEDTAPEHRRWTANSAFHMRILHAADNPLLEMVARPVFSVLRDRFLRDRAGPSFWRGVAEQHQVILDQVRVGNADAASRAMRSHLASLRETYTHIDVTQVGREAT